MWHSVQMTFSTELCFFFRYVAALSVETSSYAINLVKVIVIPNSHLHICLTLVR